MTLIPMTNISLLILCIVACVILASYLIYWFFHSILRKPVLEINLKRIEKAKWSDSGKIAELTDWFVHNGFEPAGLYECMEMPTLIISGFVHQSEQMAGVIYDHAISGIWVDIYERCTDGGSLTVSNAPAGSELDHMLQAKKIYSRGSNVEELHRIFLAERREEGRTTISREEFASDFEDQYKKEMKWRIDRGGPTASEVTKVAEEGGVRLDSEGLQKGTKQVQDIWARTIKTLGKHRRSSSDFALPADFQRPEVFRWRLEQTSGPVPRLNVPVFPVYLALIAAIGYWCYYGYQYTKTNASVSLAAILIFGVVFLILSVALMWFRAYHRQVNTYPVLKRIADLRPGAFLFIAGRSYTLFYGREKWIGKVSFQEGGECEDALTRVEARTRHIAGTLIISKNRILDKLVGWSDKDRIQMPDSDFSRKFTVSGPDAGFAGKLLSPMLSNAIMRLEEFSQPSVEIDRNSVAVQINEDLSSPRKETGLNAFLEAAESIIESIVDKCSEFSDVRTGRW